MGRGIIPRLERPLLVPRDLSASDLVRVAANENTQVAFFRQGATVAATVSLQPGATELKVQVRGIGGVVVGDSLRAGTTNRRMQVVAILGRTEIMVAHEFGEALSLTAGTRLWVVTGRPACYADALGAQPLGTSLTLAGTDGYLATYLSVDRFDYEIFHEQVRVGEAIDQAASIGRSDLYSVDIRDFDGSIHKALDVLPDTGGAIYAPSGTWTLSSGLAVAKPNVTIFGERGRTILRPSGGNSFDLLTAAAPGLRLRDLVLDGLATSYNASGKSVAVVQADDVRLERVKITRGPRYGLWVKDARSFSAEQCNIDGNPGTGARVEAVSGAALNTGFSSCTFSQNSRRGLEAHSVGGLRVLGCTFDGNQGGTGEFEGNGVELTDCRAAQVVSSTFRNADTGTRATNFLAFVGCEAPAADGCSFEGGATTSKQPVQAVVFSNCRAFRMNNCLGYQMNTRLARFTSDCADGFEMGNAEVEKLGSGAVVALAIEAEVMTSLSRRTLSLPIVSTIGLPDGVSPGALVWHSGALKYFKGPNTTDWITVALTS